MSQVDEIKNKIDIVDLLSEYIQLKQSGANWKGLCPFHQEKTPSFMVSKSRQIWHCFGCGKGGDIFSFLQEYEGLDFPEALNLLAQRAGVKLVQQDPKLRSQKQALVEINAQAAKFYNKLLTAHPLGAKAKEYLEEKRKISKEGINSWLLGYAPDKWDGLYAFMKNKSYQDETLFMAGLTVKKSGGGYYDRFRNRIMIPLSDANGQIVGFTGRVMPGADQGMGKYVNTPQTLIYNKSRLVFGYDKAKKAIKEADRVIIVEGNMDVIASALAGVREVVAVSGTALTEEQVKILKRLTDNVVFALDEDQAGAIALSRGVDICLNNDMNTKIVQLPESINGVKIKDPDECIQQDPKAWQASVSRAIPAIEYYLNKAFSRFDVNDSQGRKKIVELVLNKISFINNKVEQIFWLEKLAVMLDLNKQILIEMLKPGQFNQQSPDISRTLEKKERGQVLAKNLLVLLLKFPEKLVFVVSNILPEDIADSELSRFYKILILYYNNKKSFDYNNFREYLLKEAKDLEKFLNSLTITSEENFFGLKEDSPELEKETRYLVKEIKIYNINKKLKNIAKHLQSAEAENNDREIENLLNQFNQLQRELKNLKE